MLSNPQIRTDSGENSFNMPARYAIYYAPAAESRLWQLASEWLGRDPAAGEAGAQMVPEGIDAERFATATSSPRRYGFHATLKAPMHLSQSADTDRLLRAAETFAARQKPVEIGHLSVKSLSGFLALMPNKQSAPLGEFAANCVVHFESLRALMSPDERAKRIDTGLTQRQTDLLDQYGYPYVMEEFRYHMTLTGRLVGAELDILMTAAERWFAPALADPVIIDRISVYREQAAGAPFERLADFPFGGNT